MTDPEPSTDPTPLQLASIKELLDELGSRFTACAFVAANRPTTDGEHLMFIPYGPPSSVHGLVDAARHLTLQYLMSDE